MQLPVVQAVLPGMVMAWDLAHILLTVSAASAAAAALAIVAATVVAFVWAIAVAFILVGALPGAFDDFAFNAP